MRPASAQLLFALARAMCCVQRQQPQLSPYLKPDVLLQPGMAARTRGLLRGLAPLYVPPNATLTCTDSLEHVVPRAVLRRSDPRAVNDLHNVFTTVPSLNAKRGCMRLDAVDADEVVGEPGRFARAGFGNLVDRRRRSFCIAEPASRGAAARAALHMQRVWGCDVADSIVGGAPRAWQWHAESPPSPMERTHNLVVLCAQGTGNFLVSNETRADRLLEALVAAAAVE